MNIQTVRTVSRQHKKISETHKKKVTTNTFLGITNWTLKRAVVHPDSNSMHQVERETHASPVNTHV
jgi:hypothetical protein